MGAVITTKQALKERLSAIRAKTEVLALAASGEEAGVCVDWLHELCYEKDKTPAFRAAWVLEHIAASHPERFVPVVSNFINRLPEQHNPSCQRHFTKILMEITHPKAAKPYRQAYAEIDRERVVETVFGWLIDPCTPVAVQVNCMDILYHMRNEYDWVTAELRQQTEFLMMRHGSAAMLSRGKKIIGKLR